MLNTAFQLLPEMFFLQLYYQLLRDVLLVPRPTPHVLLELIVYPILSDDPVIQSPGEVSDGTTEQGRTRGCQRISHGILQLVDVEVCFSGRSCKIIAIFVRLRLTSGFNWVYLVKRPKQK